MVKTFNLTEKLNPNSKYFFRYACAIEMPDKVIVTGGLYTPNQVNFENVQCNDNENEYSGQVVVYNEQGWVEDWPSILTSRYDHGCGHYVNADSEVVSRWILSCILYCTMGKV